MSSQISRNGSFAVVVLLKQELTLSGSFSDMRFRKNLKVKGSKFKRSFQIFDSPIQALHYVDDGTKLAVSCECGRVAVLDMDAFSVTNVMHILSEGNTSVVEPVQQKESPKSTKDVAAKKEPSTEADQPKIEHLSSKKQ
ncbi:synaptobrevin, WD40/YVTN repeat-like-containing domain protein [Tanacetum coccineum]